MKVIKQTLSKNAIVEIDKEECFVSLHANRKVEIFIPLPDADFLESTLVPRPFLAMAELAYLLKNDPRLMENLADQYVRRIRGKQIANATVGLLIDES
jgi:hypothetical protein